MKDINLQETLKALEAVEKVRTTMQTEGWKILRSILEENITTLNDIKGVASIKELQSRQSALKSLEGFLRQADALLEAGDLYLKQQKKPAEPKIIKII